MEGGKSQDSYTIMKCTRLTGDTRQHVSIRSLTCRRIRAAGETSWFGQDARGGWRCAKEGRGDMRSDQRGEPTGKSSARSGAWCVVRTRMAAGRMSENGFGEPAAGQATSISSGSARRLGTGDLAGEGRRLSLWFAVAGVRKKTRQADRQMAMIRSASHRTYSTEINSPDLVVSCRQVLLS